jgi:hypothetical protein
LQSKQQQNQMKKHMLTGLLLIAALFTAININAQNVPPPLSFTVMGQGSVTNAGSGTNIAWAIIPALNGRAQVTFAQFITDATNGGLTFSYAQPTNVPVSVAISSNAAQAFCYVVPTGITNNDVVIYRYAPNTVNEAYQRLVVSNATATNITFTASVQAPTFAFSQGDIIYKMTTNAVVLANGAAPTTNSTNYVINVPGGLFNGPYNAPVLVVANGNTNAQIQNVSGNVK